jgi:hypothetical protein
MLEEGGEQAIRETLEVLFLCFCLRMCVCGCRFVWVFMCAFMCTCLLLWGCSTRSAPIRAAVAAELGCRVERRGEGGTDVEFIEGRRWRVDGGMCN